MLLGASVVDTLCVDGCEGSEREGTEECVTPVVSDGVLVPFVALCGVVASEEGCIAGELVVELAECDTLGVIVVVAKTVTVV